MNRRAIAHLVAAIALALGIGWCLAPRAGAVAFGEILCTAALGALVIATALRRSERAFSALATVTLVLWVGGWFVPSLLFAPRGAFACMVLTYPFVRPPARWTWVVIGGVSVAALVPTVASAPAAILVSAVAVLTTAAIRAVRAPHAGRLAAGSALTAAVALAVGWVTPVAAQAMAVSADAAVAFYPWAMAYTAVILLVDTVFGGVSEAAVAAFAVDLRGVTDHGALQARLARAIGDPSLRLLFVLPSERVVDDLGRPTTIDDDAARRAVARVSDGERTAALIDHDRAVRIPRDAEASIASATLLALRNVRLHAEVRDHATAIEESHRRLMDAEGEARASLDLAIEAGPRRRLARVRSVLDSDDTAEPLSDRIDDALDRADADLADFGEGLLAGRGGGDLARDLEAMADGMPFSTSVTVTGSEIIDADARRLIRLVCAEALTNAAKHADASLVGISVTADHLRDVEVSVIDDGSGGATFAARGLRGLRSRLEDVGGRLELSSPAGRGTALTGHIPVRVSGRSGGR